MDFIKGFKSGIWLNKAKEYISSPTKVRELLNSVLLLASKDGVKNVKDEIMLMYHFLSDVCNGRYKDYDKSSIALIIAALIYLVAPTDLVPDFIPIAGLVDDATVICWVFNEVKAKLDKYRRSKE